MPFFVNNDFMFLDTVFLAVITFIIAFTWLRYYISDNLVCLFSAIAVCALVFLGIKALSGGKKQRKTLKKQQRKEAKNLAVFLSFLPDKNTLELFEKLPRLKDREIKKSKNAVSFKEEGKTVKQVFDFNCVALSAQSFCRYVKCAKEDKADRLEIYSNSFDKAALQMREDCGLEVKLFDGKYAYSLLKKHNLAPTEITQNKPSVLRANFLRIVFDKSRAKYYLTSSLFLILTSFITFFKLYYLISGTILFFMFLYAKFNTRFNRTAESGEV